GGQVAQSHQIAADGDVENASAGARESLRGAQHLPGPRVHTHCNPMCKPVRASNIARGVVKAHQSLDPCDDIECRADCMRELFLTCALRRNLHQCSQQRTRAPQCDCWPFTHLSATSYKASRRRTPSVTCRQDRVAPPMFLISTSTLSGSPSRLPTNWRRHAALRIS